MTTPSSDLDIAEADAVLTSATVPMTEAEAAALAKQYYGIVAEAGSLRSERDQNFKLAEGSQTRFLLKLANAAEPQEVVDFKILALEHIKASWPDLPVQRLVRTIHGHKYFRWSGSDGHVRLGHVLTFLQGVPMSASERSDAQAHGLGHMAACLGKALTGFEHPASGYPLLWDLKHAGKLRRHLDRTPPGRIHDQALRALDAFEAVAEPMLPKLRSQIIHNDLNPSNVLVNPSKPSEVTGVIDFGDMVYGALVNDIAVTCSYLFGRGEDPLAPLCAFLSAYSATTPLRDEELRVLPHLIATRLAMTVIITNWRAAQYPENREYILRNQESAIYGLDVLFAQSPDSVSARFTQVCERVPS